MLISVLIFLKLLLKYDNEDRVRTKELLDEAKALQKQEAATTRNSE